MKYSKGTRDMHTLTKGNLETVATNLDWFTSGGRLNHALELGHIFKVLKVNPEDWDSDATQSMISKLREMGYDSLPYQKNPKLETSKIPFWVVENVKTANEELQLTDEEIAKLERVKTSFKSAGLPGISEVVGNYSQVHTVKVWLDQHPNSKVSSTAVLAVHYTLTNYLLNSVGFAPLSPYQLSALSGCEQRQVRRALKVLEDMRWWVEVEGKKSDKNHHNHWRTKGVKLFFPVFSEDGYQALKQLVD